MEAATTEEATAEEATTEEATAEEARAEETTAEEATAEEATAEEATTEELTAASAEAMNKGRPKSMTKVCSPRMNHGLPFCCSWKEPASRKTCPAATHGA